MTRLKPGHGNWVVGDRFWDRELEIGRYLELLEDGANLLVVAPRRIGKTSLLHEAGRRIGERFTYLVLDLEGCHSAADLVAELALATLPHKSLWQRTKDVFRTSLETAKGAVDEIKFDELSIKLRDGAGPDWLPKATRMMEELAQMDPPVVICMDELPILVNRILQGHDFEVTPGRRAAADALMSWLRSMSIRHRGRLRLVLCGSIGLEPVLRRGGLSGGVTTFSAFHLDPWDRDTATGCILALADTGGLDIAPEVAAHMVDRLGCAIPHHVQVYFDLVHADARRRRASAVGIEDVDRVYETRMLSSRGHAELSQLEERLVQVLGRRRMPLAIDLLTEAAVAGALTAEAAHLLAADHVREPDEARTVLTNVLNILEHDGYLARREERYVFLSSLLRDWWKARFAFSHERAADRRGA